MNQLKMRLLKLLMIERKRNFKYWNQQGLNENKIILENKISSIDDELEKKE